MKKKKTTRQIIRQIVREEVAMAIKEVITELKQPSLSSKPTKPQKKNYSKNSVLNDVLNETAQGGEWKTLGGKEFTSDRMNELVGGQYADMMNDTSNGKPNIVVDGRTADFLQKDYRGVMKAIDKKKGIK
tara:strand:+ start:2175 stop:2564 length:390 start_codon:yes stop_codon:yes gene_type:complete